MAIVTLEAMKAELGILDDVDDAMISAKLEESQAWLESFLGYAIADEYPDAVPADLVMAVKMQCGHLFENRESTIAGVSIQLVPNGVDDIIANRRRYSFDGA